MPTPLPHRKLLFTARMTRDEIDMVQRLAAEEGISASDYVRQFVRRAYVQRYGALKSSTRQTATRRKSSK